MRTLLFVFVLLFPLSLLAQSHPAPPPTEAYVIATSGVNMRARPNLQGRKVLAIPYGKTVTILDDSASAPLKVGDIVGCWQKVQYKNKNGYTFSAFLSREYTPEATKTPFLLFNSNISCKGNLRYDPDFTYYAISVAKDGQSKVEPVDISFYQRPLGELDGTFLQLDWGGAKLRGMVVGGKWTAGKSIPALDLPNNVNDNTWQEVRETQTIDLWGEFVLEYRWTWGEDEKQPLTYQIWVTEPEGEREQLICGTGTPLQYLPLLKWTGDLDGDGMPDFVLESDKGSAHLFLSSLARKGKLVGHAASYIGGYCC